MCCNLCSVPIRGARSVHSQQTSARITPRPRHVVDMNPKLSAVVDARGGWFTRADALACGYGDSTIRHRVRIGRWLRLCRDGYAEPAGWPGDEKSWDRTRRLHCLTARAVHHRAGAGAVVSHQSAVVLHGLPDWRVDLTRVHLTKATGRAGKTAGVVRHCAVLPPADVAQLDDVQVTAPARAVVETACGMTYEAAVVLYDACVRAGLATVGQIADTAERLSHWSGAPVARTAAAFVDGRSESVGESRLRVFLANQGLPPPELQVELRDRDGNFVGRVDFFFPEYRLVIEFDGLVKYGSDAGSVVAEKRREDRIRELGYLVLRVTWVDLRRPAELSARIRHAISLAARAA
jgi:very-short-patch-repair endonuclease